MQSKLLRCLAAIVAWGGLTLPLAQAFSGRGISDGGDFFDDNHERQAQRRIDELHSKFGKDVRVESFAKVPDHLAAKLKKSGSDTFFKEWLKERAQAEHVNGVFVLLCKNPAMIKVGVNEATRKSLFTEADREALWKLVKRRFDNKDFNGGLSDGLDYIQDRFKAHASAQPLAEANPPPPRPHPNPNPNPRVPVQQPQGTGIMGIILFVAILFAGFMIVRALFRAMTGSGGGGNPGPGYSGGGGGWGSSFLSGIFGAAVGNMMYDSFFRGHSPSFDTHSSLDNSASAGESNHSADSGSSSQDDWSVNDGGAFGDSSPSDDGGDFGGGDFGGGGSDF